MKAGRAPSGVIAFDELLPGPRIRLDLEASSAREVLEELARLLGGQDRSVREAVRDDLVARENMATTGVGGGIAFPHARVDSLPGIRLALVRTAAPVDFAALDGWPVDLFVGVAGPAQRRRQYLSALGRLAYLFRSEELREALRIAPDAPAVQRLLIEATNASVGGSANPQ